MMRKKAPMHALADACLMRAPHHASRKRNASGCPMQWGSASAEARLRRAFLNTESVEDACAFKIRFQSTFPSAAAAYPIPPKRGMGEVNVGRSYPYLQDKPESRETASRGPPASVCVHYREAQGRKTKTKQKRTSNQ
ncbi:hypothetical protein Tco_1056139 [Tanacetum coccineum]|uniref:Uncharacterized protein n=1 Tax=Tanacetum coccineum TaxID=301880 RepID=A0ABQ5H1N9_9ASTR